MMAKSQRDERTRRRSAQFFRPSGTRARWARGPSPEGLGYFRRFPVGKRGGGWFNPALLMRYDLALIQELCVELGLHCAMQSSTLLAIDLGDGAVLCFQNAEKEDDSLVGFEGTPSHIHDNFMFVDSRAYYIEIDYLGVLTGLKDGRILVCELWHDGKIVDRNLVHSEYNDELRYMQHGDEIRIRRAVVTSSSPTPSTPR